MCVKRRDMGVCQEWQPLCKLSCESRMGKVRDEVNDVTAGLIHINLDRKNQ